MGIYRATLRCYKNGHALKNIVFTFNRDFPQTIRHHHSKVRELVKIVKRSRAFTGHISQFCVLGQSGVNADSRGGVIDRVGPKTPFMVKCATSTSNLKNVSHTIAFNDDWNRSVSANLLSQDLTEAVYSQGPQRAGTPKCKSSKKSLEKKRVPYFSGPTPHPKFC